jgi:hypothetical protein
MLAPRLSKARLGIVLWLVLGCAGITREKGRTPVRTENSKSLCRPAATQRPNVLILVLDYLSETRSSPLSC